MRGRICQIADLPAMNDDDDDNDGGDDDGGCGVGGDGGNDDDDDDKFKFHKTTVSFSSRIRY